MTVEEILQLPKEKRLEYVMEQRHIQRPTCLEELLKYIEISADYCLILSSIEESERLIGWYEGQNTAYKNVLGILKSTIIINN